MNEGSNMKNKGWLAYKMGKRSDGYITDIIAISHPASFSKGTLQYGAWKRVMTPPNSGHAEEQVTEDGKKRQVLLWYVTDDQV